MGLVKDIKTGKKSEVGPFESTIRQFGVDYLSQKLNEESVDMTARASAMLDIVEEEKRLAAEEKAARKEQKQREGYIADVRFCVFGREGERRRMEIPQDDEIGCVRRTA